MLSHDCGQCRGIYAQSHCRYCFCFRCGYRVIVACGQSKLNHFLNNAIIWFFTSKKKSNRRFSTILFISNGIRFRFTNSYIQRIDHCVPILSIHVHIYYTSTRVPFITQDSYSFMCDLFHYINIFNVYSPLCIDMRVCVWIYVHSLKLHFVYRLMHRTVT